MSIFGKIVGKLDEEKNKIQKIINESINEPTNSTSELFDSKENNIHDPISNKQNQIVKEEQTVSVTVNANQSPPTYQPMSSNMASQTESVQQTQPRQSTTPQMHQSAAINISSQTNPGQANTAAQAKSVQMPQPTQQFASNPTLSKRVENQDVSLPPVVNIGNINDGKFSDVYITPDKKTYIWGGKTNAGLQEVIFGDFEDFYNKINEAYDGISSYLLKYKGRNYRVERTVATEGHQFCARKMPVEIPNLKSLGLPIGVYKHLLSLANCGGMILLAGATGSGKSTTIASLLKEYLCTAGGYAFTIEDPVELPLDGVYVTSNKEIGLCKQTIPPNGVWAEGIKSALRSKPRYIYLGEIRSPDTASEALRAATSGHLVLSSIHANNVSEAVNSLIKYAASSGISESMAHELVAGGLLGIVHQILSGAPKKAHVTSIFTNPDVNAGCQVRGMIRNGKLNVATIIEQQRILLDMGKPLFK